MASGSILQGEMSTCLPYDVIMRILLMFCMWRVVGACAKGKAGCDHDYRQGSTKIPMGNGWELEDS